MPSRNPLPLSASQEAQVREVFNARVRQLCAEDIKGASCSHLSPPLSLRLSFYSVPFLVPERQVMSSASLLLLPIPPRRDRKPRPLC